MRALWTETEAEYHGELANLERSWSWPKPAQPSIPVLLGAAGRERAHGGDRRSGPTDGCPAGHPAGSATGSRSCGGDGARPVAPTSGPIIWFIQDAVDAEKLRTTGSNASPRSVSTRWSSRSTPSNANEILPVLDRYEKVIAANAG